MAKGVEDSRGMLAPFTMQRLLTISQRLYHGLVEMLVLLNLDPSDVRAARLYRLQVKERLYRFNFVSSLLIS